MTAQTRRKLERLRDRDRKAQERVQAATDDAARVRAELLDAIRESGLSLSQVGEILGISKQRVHQLLARD